MYFKTFTPLEYLSSAQSVHTALPDSTLYLPAKHSWQSPPSGPLEPGSQMQSILLLLAAGAWDRIGHDSHLLDVAPTIVEYWFIMQLVHAASPVCGLYFPAKHWAQDWPFCPVNPLLHVQLVAVVLATLLLPEFKGQVFFLTQSNHCAQHDHHWFFQHAVCALPSRQDAPSDAYRAGNGHTHLSWRQHKMPCWATRFWCHQHYFRAIDRHRGHRAARFDTHALLNLVPVLFGAGGALNYQATAWRINIFWFLLN